MTTVLRTKLITFLTLCVIVVSMIGLADSAYVTYEEFSGKIPVCGAGFDCGTVLKSKWAKIGPVPVSAFGMVFYATIFTLGILEYLAVPFPNKTFKKKFPQIQSFLKNLPKIGFFFDEITWQKKAFLLSIAGMLFTIYLVSIMAFVLNAWCLFCLISAASTTTIFLSQSFLTYLNHTKSVE